MSIKGRVHSDGFLWQSQLGSANQVLSDIPLLNLPSSACNKPLLLVFQKSSRKSFRPRGRAVPQKKTSAGTSELSFTKDARLSPYVAAVAWLRDAAGLLPHKERCPTSNRTKLNQSSKKRHMQAACKQLASNLSQKRFAMQFAMQSMQDIFGSSQGA